MPTIGDMERSKQPSIAVDAEDGDYVYPQHMEQHQLKWTFPRLTIHLITIIPRSVNYHARAYNGIERRQTPFWEDALRLC